ncbi:MAG: winged helix-turn-helix domain-containing protein [Terracidiphilus sp.]|nr:winged helix-turn-helix domain-containing protein [Terracidiphilus sp.]
MGTDYGKSENAAHIKWNQVPTSTGIRNISRQSVSRWFDALRQDKPDWIRAAGRAGRRPKLDGRNSSKWTRLCVKAQAHGFGTDLWTLPRVVTVIERAAGVHYHPGHVWKILAALE